jgi:hypothetical protein
MAIVIRAVNACRTSRSHIGRATSAATGLAAMIKYASEIKKTANGCWSRSGRQTRRNKEVLAQRRVQTNGEVDEQKATQRLRQHQAKEPSNKETI